MAETQTLNTHSKRLPLTLACHAGDNGTGKAGQAQSLPPVSRSEAMAFLKSAWQKTPDTYVFLNQGDENLFVIAQGASDNGKAEAEETKTEAGAEAAFDIRIRVRDTFGLLGLIGKTQTLELEYGPLPASDVEHLLKHFYDGNYLALRSLHRGLKVNS
jgi:hypothetical protein